MRSSAAFGALFCGFTLLSTATFAQHPTPPGFPDLGPNVHIITPATPAAEAQAAVNRAYAVQQHSEFGKRRDAFLFLPGSYKLDVPVGFYTEVIGLGTAPDATHITGNVHADASVENNNATTTFWRGLTNLSVTPTGGTMQWAVSQAVFLRRVHIQGDLVLHQKHGWASGGWMADSLIEGNVDSGTQQQWISRNCDWKSWTGANWNMVFVGVPHAPANSWPEPPYTTLASTPVIREKPFLQVDAAGFWSLRVPTLRRDTAGPTWTGSDAGSTSGRSVSLSKFYIAHAGTDSAATLNAQLALGRHLLLTPGIYELTAPLRITRPGTIVYGIGFATLRPTQGTAAIVTADADGLILAGLLFDAGEQLSPVLLQVGQPGSTAHHREAPISLHDVFFRVGGAGVGRTVGNLEINSNDTIVDHTWIWRADHGEGVGWDKNLSRNGLVVNGNDITIYGLFVEHHQQFQVLWNGNRGRTYFYQSEIPYDPPTQAAYNADAPPGTNGWASYKLADNVTQHEAWGLGIYSVFTLPNVSLTRAIETPTAPGVQFHDMITVCLLDHSGIEHIVNDTGGAATCHPHNWPRLTAFPSR